MMEKENGKRRKSLLIDGVKYYTYFTKKFENRTSWDKPNEKHIKSYIPGTIKKVFVKDGQKVKTGQRLFVLEAMKMNNTIYAEGPGVIEKVYVETDQKIPKGFLVLELQ